VVDEAGRIALLGRVDIPSPGHGTGLEALARLTVAILLGVFIVAALLVIVVIRISAVLLVVLVLVIN
jgi:hypothetical protein